MPLASTVAATTLIGLADKFQEFFYGEAGDVTFDYMDEDGNIQTTTVMNVAKVVKYLDDNGATDEEVSDAVLNNNKILNDYMAGDAGDVTFDYKDENGDKQSVTVPNIAKLEETILSSGTTVTMLSDDATITIGGFYLAYTKDKSITVTLDTDVVDGAMMIVMDRHNNAQNNPTTISGNGKKINDKDEDLTCDVNGYYCVVMYDKGADAWYLTNTNN